MRNKMSDVRNHLVAMMELLGDDKQSPEQAKANIDRARAVSDLARAYTDTVKIEVQAHELLGSRIKDLPAPLRLEQQS